MLNGITVSVKETGGKVAWVATWPARACLACRVRLHRQGTWRHHGLRRSVVNHHIEALRTAICGVASKPSHGTRLLNTTSTGLRVQPSKNLRSFALAVRGDS